eukprot:scaffold63499_cov18-Tisochrysis_lutea.AAC.2
MEAWCSHSHAPMHTCALAPPRLHPKVVSLCLRNLFQAQQRKHKHFNSPASTECKYQIGQSCLIAMLLQIYKACYLENSSMQLGFGIREAVNVSAAVWDPGSTL